MKKLTPEEKVASDARAKVRMRNWYLNNIEKVKKDCHEYYLKNKETIIQQATQWNKNNPEKARESVRKSVRKAREQLDADMKKALYEKDRFKILARKAVGRAVKRGTLLRPDSCSACGVTCVPHGHHHNGYDEEHKLDVVWLCGPCHKAS